MNRTYLDKQGLDKVADKFKSKLTMSDTIPAASSELKGKRILYTGEYKTDLYGIYIPGKIYTCVESGVPGYYNWTPDTADIYGNVQNGKFVTQTGDEIDEIGIMGSVMNDLQTGAEYSIAHWQSSFDDRVCKLLSRDLSYIKNDASIKCQIGYYIANNITKYRYIHDGESTSAFVNGYLYVLDVVEVEPVGTENPMEEKWLERQDYGGQYMFNPTHDTAVNLSKTYYDIAFIQTDIQPGVTVDDFNPDDFDIDESTKEVSLDPSQRIFSGTLEEWDALTAEEQAKYGYIASPNSGGDDGGGTNDNFVGTLAEWNALSLAEQIKYKTADITDDFNGAPIDSALSDTSINPVQNKVITEEFGGIGTALSGKGDATDILIPNNTITATYSVELTKGMWIVIGQIDWQANTNGYRQIQFTTGGINPARDQAITSVPSSLATKEHYMQIVKIFTVGSTDTITLYALQTSGGDLTAYPAIRAIRIR